MAYMDEMALERERSRQKMLEGKTPLLGADTEAVLNSVGFTVDEIAALRAAGAV